MGGFCSKNTAVDNVLSSNLSQKNDNINHGAGLFSETPAFQTKRMSDSALPSGEEENAEKLLKKPSLFSELGAGTLETNVLSYEIALDDNYDGIPRLPGISSHKSRSTMSKQAAVAKVSEVSSLLNKAGGKAVEVLDTLGSSMTGLHLNGGFASGGTTKGNKISILAFEVANTIVKGANLMHSLSHENITHLKEVVLRSDGVQNLISKDTDELHRIVAADKREELKVFSGEVVRFGNRCKDPQYHNLDRYFEKVTSEPNPQRQLKEEADAIVQRLMLLVQYTAELYHELDALDRFEQDYRRKLQEEDNPSITQRGDSLAILKSELKSQSKHVRSLKKKSLWSRILEDVMVKLVDIVYFLNFKIYEAFGSAEVDKPVKSSLNNRKKLGSAGLALHYANVITQIYTLVSRPNSVPQNSIDGLYQGLPTNVKSALRSKLRSFQLDEEFTIPEIKAEIEKTLEWLVPIATNTTKAHHGFGWVGEWANIGLDMNRKPGGQHDLLRIETLYHANKDKTESYILDLVILLHHLISISRVNIARSPNQKTVSPSPQKASCSSPTLTIEDQQMLRDVSTRKLTPGISKSQEFNTAKNNRFSKHRRLCKSNSHSPSRDGKRELWSTRRPSFLPVIDFDMDRVRALDVIDRVDTIKSL